MTFPSKNEGAIMENDSKKDETREPDGLGENTRGPGAEAAHEQGWDLNEEERTKQPEGRPQHYGGKGYDYGAQDFGDVPAKRENPDKISNDAEPDQNRKAS
jgi:hypothetical protein